MAAEVVDSIIAQLEVRLGNYVTNFEKASQAVRGHTAALKGLAAADATSSQRLAGKRDMAANEQRAADAIVRTRRKQADDITAIAEREVVTAKAAAKAKADAEIAEAERSARYRALAERAAARASAGIAPAVTAATAYGSRGVVAAQTRIMSSTSLSGSGAGAQVAIEREINHVIADRADLQRRLQIATAGESAEIRSQLADLQRWSAYKRAGLTDEEALLRVEREASIIEAQRTRQAAERAAIMERQIAANANKVANKVSLLAPALIGGIGVAELSHLNDKYIELGNSLRIAGVGAAEFDTVQDRLFQTSLKTGTGINALADVFRSASLASHDLGASQTDILRITDAVGNALRIQGVSATQAQGALLQLGHAFESGRVTAREFNSLSLNLYPILQAVAAGSNKWGGSVAKLRTELVSTGVSSKEFFQSLLAGAGTLEGRAAKATLTTAQGFTALNNALIVYFGTADQAQGTSAAFGAALQSLAKNLDTVIPAIAAIGTALTVGYISRAVAAAAATEGLGVAALAAFGGPVGIAITAVTLAVAAFAIEANNASSAAQKSAEGLSQLEDMYGKVGAAGHGAAAELRGIGDDALSQIKKINGFSGAIQGLTGDLLKQAAAARLARIELLDKQIADSKSKERDAFANTPAGRANLAQENLSALKRGNVSQYLSGAVRYTYGAVANFFSNGEDGQNYQKAFENQARQTGLLQRERNRLSNLPLTPSDLPGGGVGGTSLANQKAISKLEAKVAGLEKIAAQQTGKQREATEARLDKARQQLDYLRQGIDPSAAAAGVAGARSGPSAKTLARQAEAERLKGIRREDAYDVEVQSLNSAILSAKGKQAQGIEQQYQAAVANADAEEKERGIKYQNLENEGKIDDAKRRFLVSLSQQVTAQQKLTAATERQNALAEQALQAQADGANNRADAIRVRADVTLSRRRRAELEDQAIAEEFKARRANLERQYQSAALNGQDTTGIEGQLANLPDQEAAAHFQNARNNASVGQRYKESLPRTAEEINDAFDNVKARGLQSLDDKLTDTISNVFKLGGAFGDVANSIIHDLIRIGVQRAIVAPLADALFPKDGASGGGIGGLFKAIGGAIGIHGARSAGGNVVGGNSYLIGENGPEIVNFGMSGRVYPNGRLPGISGAAAPSITTKEFTERFVAYADGRAAQARNEAVQIAGQQVPGRVAQYQRFRA